MNLRYPIHVLDVHRKFIYKIDTVKELGSGSHALQYELELVAGHDYINPDENDIQGFVDAEAFTEDVQYEDITVFPLDESLGVRLKEEGYRVIKIDDYKIHPFLGGEDDEESF